MLHLSPLSALMLYKSFNSRRSSRICKAKFQSEASHDRLGGQELNSLELIITNFRPLKTEIIKKL